MSRALLNGKGGVARVALVDDGHPEWNQATVSHPTELIRLSAVRMAALMEWIARSSVLHPRSNQ